MFVSFQCSKDDYEKGNIGSKAGALGQILEKPCVRFGYTPHFQYDTHETW